MLHVADLVREELHYSLVATDFAKLAEDQEEGLDLCRNFVGLGLNCLTNVDLKEAHHRCDEGFQDRVEDT